MNVKSILRIASPCIVAALFCLIVIVVSFLDLTNSKGYSLLGIILFLPTLLILLAFDVSMRYVFRKDLLYFWLSELFVVCSAIWFLREKYGLFR
jgi:hypothetical protein